MNTCTAMILLPTVKVPLTQGKFATINEADWPVICLHKWYARLHHTKKFYAYRLINKSGENVSMAKVIARTPKGFVTDHWNGITLDNRRSNLRVATLSQNGGNARVFKGRSKYKGVTWNDGYGEKRWMARIGKDPQRIYLGNFLTEEDAARAYNKAALAKWGEFACLNVIPD